MPKGCRFMSDYPDLFYQLPSQGWYILNKTLCGCGGTTAFINSGRDVVIVSPRLNMLKSKKQQHKETFLFREFSKEKVSDMIKKLYDYISWKEGYGEPKIILVTVDSYKYVAEVLSRRSIADNFLVLVDEFQCLMSDALFKGITELEFLECLRLTASNVCFMSATPINITYLSYVEQFKGVLYYQLEWDPDVIEIPNLKEVQMKRDETPRTVCKRIIEDYKKNGYFACKRWNGQVVWSRQITIFLNEVKTIMNVINDNKLQPSEVSILCSESTSQKVEIKKKGFKIGEQCTDRSCPVYKTYTFCTSASFEGVDLYSDSAITVIFVNAQKEWETCDIAIGLPQILARQRLYSVNPFCRDAVIYYKTKFNPKTKDEIVAKVEEKLRVSNLLIENYSRLDEEAKDITANSLNDLQRIKNYEYHYLDAIDVGQGLNFQINGLVILAEMNLWWMQSNYYKDKMRFIAGVTDNMKNNYKGKPDHLGEFERSFYDCGSQVGRLKMYCEFRDRYPGETGLLLANPFIPVEYHHYYECLGTDRIKEIGYLERKIRDEYDFICRLSEIQELCRISFNQNTFYPLSEVKMKLGNIYLQLGIQRCSKAIDIKMYLPVMEKNGTDENGKRIKGYVIC